jgi:hypothetical protein
MARKFLKNNGIVIYRTSVRRLTPDKIQSRTENKEREDFDIPIEKKFGASMDKNDFRDDPDYADFVTPIMTAMKMMKYPPLRCQILMISKRRMMLTHMTNMWEPM